jgi:hypothetical protein
MRCGAVGIMETESLDRPRALMTPRGKKLSAAVGSVARCDCAVGTAPDRHAWRIPGQLAGVRWNTE